MSVVDVDGVINSLWPLTDNEYYTLKEQDEGARHNLALRRGYRLWPRYPNGKRMFTADSYHHKDVPYILNWLDEHTELNWCTVHQRYAPHLGHWFGLPLRPWLTSSRPTPETDAWGESYWTEEELESFKTPSKYNPLRRDYFIDGRMLVLHEELEGRPLVWIDDDAKAPASHDWARRRNEAGVPTLIVAPDPSFGLRGYHLNRIRAWIDEIAD